MIESWKNKYCEAIGLGENTKATQKILPTELHEGAYHKITILDSIASLEELRGRPSFRLEKLKGNRKDCWSIRVNKQYRICFQWDGQNAEEVEIVDYHRRKKL